MNFPTAAQHPRPVIVIDFGAQYSQLITRRVREAGIYSELVPHTLSPQDILAKHPLALILSGGPSSVYQPGAPRLDPALLDAGIPVLGICYGFQAMAHALGGHVQATGTREYGSTPINATATGILTGIRPSDRVWMSHSDAVHTPPPGCKALAHTEGSPVAAFGDPERKLYGVQWHPEVKHSDFGQTVIENFLYQEAALRPNWHTDDVIAEQIAYIRHRIGPDERALCGLSGGVDSAVAAALVHRAIGERLECVFVDHGLLREGEAEDVERNFTAATGAQLHIVRAAERFQAALAGVTDPETKRSIIGAEFIRAFEEAERALAAQDDKPIRFLVQGTLYPDVVESGGGANTATIKSHHNVGGLPPDLRYTIIEPLRTLFKDEVRAVGTHLGLPHHIIHRHPFPGPGLAIRIVGEVTAQNLAIVRRADAIARQETTKAGLDEHLWQMPVVLLADVRSVGAQGDGRSYGHPIVLRPTTSDDAMTADWYRMPYETLATISTRITNEIPEVNRVVLDVTSKPPGTIEWE